MTEFLSNCRIAHLNENILSDCRPFCCGDEDIDDFFKTDAVNYSKQLLGKSYYYTQKTDLQTIVCAFTLSNSSMDVRHLPGSRKKAVNSEIPREKHLSSYPALLIGRLGVSRNFAGKGVGSELLDMIKSIALTDTNWAACRFLTVDAYNNAATRKFYESNGFIYLFTSEQQEKDYLKMLPERELKTRLMYFDLLRIA